MRIVKAKSKTRGPLTSAEKVAAHRARGRQVARRACADPKRRKRLERDPKKWIPHYCGKQAFDGPFSVAHRAIIDNGMWSIANKTGSAAAIPRGDGKTTTYFGFALYLVATRRIRFPVVVGWQFTHAQEMFDSWLRALSDEDSPLAADYPELTQPFEISTHQTALKNLTWADTGEKCGAVVKTMHKVLILPSSIGAIAARSSQGDAKGLYAQLSDGTRLRPDFLLFDDAQDPERAGNPDFANRTFDKHVNVFMGMAGPRKRLTCATACMVEAEGDVSCKHLEVPGWRTVRYSRIQKWPGGDSGGDWPAEADDPQRILWDEWNRIRNEDGQAKANTFFRRNRKKLVAGMKVLWSYRWDRDVDVCALDAAMRDYYTLGASVFSRAQQQYPIREGVTIYNLTPDIITARADKARKPGEIPEWSRLVVAATDINPSYALSTVILAIGQDQRAAVLWYGKHQLKADDRRTEAQIKAYIMAELETHGKQLAALPCRPERWIIDGGGTPQDTVINFAATSVRTTGLEAFCSFGRSWNYVRPKQADRKFEHGFIRAESRSRRWIIYNSDYWRELAQRAWLAAIGAPGSCDLPAGKHDEFAQQICAEWLKDKAELAGGWAYKWEHLPGPHDFGDCVYMAFAMAAAVGIGTGGQVVRTKQKSRRRVRHVKV